MRRKSFTMTIQTQRMLLRPEAIVRYLQGNDDKLDTLIVCKPENIELITYDQHLYEALGSMDRNKIDYNKLVKLLEVVKISSVDRIMLTDQKVQQIRDSMTKKMHNAFAG